MAEPTFYFQTKRDSQNPYLHERRECFFQIRYHLRSKKIWMQETIETWVILEQWLVFLTRNPSTHPTKTQIMADFVIYLKMSIDTKPLNYISEAEFELALS